MQANIEVYRLVKKVIDDDIGVGIVCYGNLYRLRGKYNTG